MRLPRFGTDGVRGVANIDLTPDVALALARAASEILGGGPENRVVIGRDTRRSGPMLEAALVAGFTACGIDVVLLGVVTTPAVAWASQRGDCTGVMISGSHNPFADNGIKLFAAGGKKLADADEAPIESAMHRYLQHPVPATNQTGNELGVVVPGDGGPGWAQSVVDSIEGRTLAGMRVVLDCAHGSAFEVGPEVFQKLGADVVVIGAAPTGSNINDAVGSTYPAALQSAVLEAGAHLGLAFDGDADRLIAVDHAGATVDGDHILSILATDWKSSGRLHHDTVVVTVMSNLGFKLAMQDAGINVIETGVGDRYVLEALNAGAGGKNFSLGGEQSGHVICRDLTSTGDGVLAGVQLVDTVIRSGRTLQELASEAMTTYPQVLKNVRLPRPDPDIVAKLAPAIAEAERQLGDQGRVLVRPSGTEPLVRIMVEHLDQATADRVCDHLVGISAQLVAVNAEP